MVPRSISFQTGVVRTLDNSKSKILSALPHHRLKTLPICSWFAEGVFFLAFILCCATALIFSTTLLLKKAVDRGSPGPLEAS